MYNEDEEEVDDVFKMGADDDENDDLDMPDIPDMPEDPDLLSDEDPDKDS